MHIATDDTIYIVSEGNEFYRIDADNFGMGHLLMNNDTIKIWGIDSVRIDRVYLNDVQ